MHGVVTTTGWRAGHREKALEKEGNFTPANPRASGTIVWCHDISGEFDWGAGWVLGPCYFLFLFLFYCFLQVKVKGGFLGNLWVRAIGVSSQWEG
jgi:hypothetical protein